MLDCAELDRLEREIAAEKARRAWFGVAGAVAGLVTLSVANGGAGAFAVGVLQAFEQIQSNLQLHSWDTDLLALATAAAITLVSLTFVYSSPLIPRKR